MNDPQLYRHSGRFSVSGLLLGFLVTAVVGSALAFIYAYAVRLLPFVYINALLTLGFGFLLGLIANKFVVRFKIRNGALALIMTFLAVLVAYYCAWVVWMVGHLCAAEMRASVFSLALHPLGVWDLIRVFNEIGTWSIGQQSWGRVTGVFLAIVWIAEAVMIFAAALLTVRGRLLTPFCEECGTWCKERKGIAAVGGDAMESLQQRVRNKDWAVLEESGPGKPHLGTWCTLDLYACPSCGVTNTLTLNAVTWSIGKDGESKKQASVVIDRLLLTADETQALLATCDNLQARAAAETAAPPATKADQAASAESETA